MRDLIEERSLAQVDRILKRLEVLKEGFGKLEAENKRLKSELKHAHDTISGMRDFIKGV